MIHVNETAPFLSGGLVGDYIQSGSVALVRAERIKGKDANGRVYHIGFTAVDDQGGACSDEVMVGVPVSRKAVPVDDGALYDSTVTP